MDETTKTGTEVPAGGHKAAFPPFEAATFLSQIVWLAIAFGLLYLLMSRLALPRVESILARRREIILADVQQARAAKAESDAAAAAHEAALAKARANAQAIAAETRAGVNAEADASRRALEADLNARLATSEAEIQASKTRALSNVRSIAADAASAIVEQLTGRTPSPGEVLSAVDAAAGK